MAESQALRVVTVGLGPIGATTTRIVLERRSLRLVAAVDSDPAKQGRDLAEVLELEAPTGVIVGGDLAEALQRHEPDVLLLCTSSFFPEVRRDLLLAAAAGVDVVSSCEEMLLPDLSHPELAREIHEAAVAGGATLLGTGVNPGFVLDFLPVLATAVSREVVHVRGLRIVDAGTRRLPLQRKVGAGLSVDEFGERVAAGRLGHIGMRESVALVGRALGIELDEVTQTVEPVVADSDRSTRFLTIPAGSVAGIRNEGVGRQRGEVRVQLQLQMYVGAPEPRDEVFLLGRPNLHLRIDGGVAGDEATAAILVNSLRQVVAAPPGLKTVLDLPPPRLTP
ncbi:MAG TPA: dihydrodipicolinate reductase [Thermoanaerobaculia bacterium]|nr:dihydrodipicolinate reductase [Thermoanaerobaculia bacterium]